MRCANITGLRAQGARIQPAVCLPFLGVASASFFWQCPSELGYKKDSGASNRNGIDLQIYRFDQWEHARCQFNRSTLVNLSWLFAGLCRYSLQQCVSNEKINNLGIRGQ